MKKQKEKKYQGYNRMLSMVIKKIVIFTLLIVSIVLMTILPYNDNTYVKIYSFIILIMLIVLISLLFLGAYTTIIIHGYQIYKATNNKKHLYWSIFCLGGYGHIFIILKDKENLDKIKF